MKKLEVNLSGLNSRVKDPFDALNRLDPISINFNSKIESNHIIEAQKEKIKKIDGAIVEQAKKAREAFKINTDFDYFNCVVFLSTEQRQAFQKALGIDPEIRYIDGIELAKQLNIELPLVDYKPHIGKNDSKVTSQLPILK